MEVLTLPWESHIMELMLDLKSGIWVMLFMQEGRILAKEVAGGKVLKQRNMKASENLRVGQHSRM